MFSKTFSVKFNFSNVLSIQNFQNINLNYSNMSTISNLSVKWNNTEYDISYINNTDTVLALKELIFDVTGVRPERQKLLNIKYQGKMPTDNCLMSDLNLKPGFKILMMGSLEEAIKNASTQPEDLPEVIDDLDVEDVNLDNPDIHLAKIERRIREYKVNIINEPRPGKKLLVLDIDYTLFDFRSVAETGNELMRPYLHEFLTDAYVNYDIAIWSATGMKWIEEKMKLLGVSKHPDYNISFYLDSGAMISVHTEKYGVVEIKPLKVIWGKFPCYTPQNTIMFDDIRRNFLMNPKNGLRIKPFRKAHFNRATDRELLKLLKYLRLIADVEDLTELNHRHWERYVKDHHEKTKKRKREESNNRPDEQSGDGNDNDDDGFNDTACSSS